MADLSYHETDGLYDTHPAALAARFGAKAAGLMRTQQDAATTARLAATMAFQANPRLRDEPYDGVTTGTVIGRIEPKPWRKEPESLFVQFANFTRAHAARIVGSITPDVPFGDEPDRCIYCGAVGDSDRFTPYCSDICSINAERS